MHGDEPRPRYRVRAIERRRSSRCRARATAPINGAITGGACRRAWETSSTTRSWVRARGRGFQGGLRTTPRRAGAQLQVRFELLATRRVSGIIICNPDKVLLHDARPRGCCKPQIWGTSRAQGRACAPGAVIGPVMNSAHGPQHPARRAGAVRARQVPACSPDDAAAHLWRRLITPFAKVCFAPSSASASRCTFSRATRCPFPCPPQLRRHHPATRTRPFSIRSTSPPRTRGPLRRARRPGARARGLAHTEACPGATGLGLRLGHANEKLRRPLAVRPSTRAPFGAHLAAPLPAGSTRRERRLPRVAISCTRVRSGARSFW